MKIVRGWKTPDISSSKKNEMLKEALFYLAVTFGSWIIGIFLVTDPDKGFGTMFLQYIGFCRPSAALLVTFVYGVASIVMVISVMIHATGFIFVAFTFKRLNWVLFVGCLLIFAIVTNPTGKDISKFYRNVYNPIPLYVGDKLEVYGFDRDRSDLRILRDHSKCSP